MKKTVYELLEDSVVKVLEFDPEFTDLRDGLYLTQELTAECTLTCNELIATILASKYKTPEEAPKEVFDIWGEFLNLDTDDGIYLKDIV